MREQQEAWEVTEEQTGINAGNPQDPRSADGAGIKIATRPGPAVWVGFYRGPVLLGSLALKADGMEQLALQILEAVGKAKGTNVMTDRPN